VFGQGNSGVAIRRDSVLITKPKMKYFYSFVHKAALMPAC